MNETQKQALATYLRASSDPTVVAAIAIRDDVTLTDWCNAYASPTQQAWMNSVPVETLDEATNWTAFDTMSAGKRDSYSMLLKFPRDFTRNKVRGWIKDLWGAVTAGSDSEKLLQAGLENVRNVELAIGTTTVVEGTVSALKRDYVGTIGLSDLSNALNRY